MKDKALVNFAIGVIGGFMLSSFDNKTNNSTNSKSFKMAKVTLINGDLSFRKCDNGGCGHFGASRDGGKRKHLGQDILCTPNAPVYAPYDAIVQREVDAYGDGKYGGLQFFVPDFNLVVKVMYFKPLDGLVNSAVRAGQLVGYCQNVSTRYGSHVPPHLHVETIKNDTHQDPMLYL